MMRRNIAQLPVKSLALGLIALVIVALACGPSVPAGQGGTLEPTVEVEATDTATPEAAPTDTPTPEPTPTLFMIDNGVPRVVGHPVKPKYTNLS